MRTEYIFYDRDTGRIENGRNLTEGKKAEHLRLNKNLDCIVNTDGVNVRSAKNGKYSVNPVTKQLVLTPIPPADPEELYILVRAKRNRELEKTDWTQFENAPLTAERKTAFATYRQQLRDLPSQYPNLVDADDYDDIVWPQRP